ncbi:UNVERIFIED_CONTAM: hypothetical protein Sradi_6917500 [Sesamum radiatum]|uniref:DUF4283 domain-containing protein n=1 Tax=Sesamum radiatum TaxID=300843 RepID=A0AAW2JH91_SESRA
MLSSLSHTSHTTSSSHSHLPADDGVNRGVAAGDSPGGRQPTLNSLEERVRQEFDFPEFYSLASRVLDGDEESLGKLLDLKARWERRFPDHNRARRLFPRFPSKPTFLPRRSIIQPVAELADLADQNDPADEKCQENLPNSQSGPSSANSPVQEPEVFIGKVKLAMDKSDCIAEAFLNSSRKTLRYIPPISQNEEIIIKPTPAMVAQGSQRWQSTAVGYFLGRRPYFPQLEAFARENWKGLLQVSATANGFFFFRFKTMAYMEEVIEEGPWLFQGQPVVLKPWEQGMTLRRQKHLQVPVWIRIRHLPMEYWTEEDLILQEFVLCLISIPNCLKHLVVLSPILSEGKEVPIKVDIEYEWLPLRCKQCCSLGHTANSCPEVKVVKQRVPVTVYVQKQRTVVSHVTRGPNDDVETTSGQVEPRGGTCPTQPTTDAGGDVAMSTATQRIDISSLSAPTQLKELDPSDKGKQIILYNPFEVLQSEEGVGEGDMHQVHNPGPILSSPAHLPP